MRLTVLLPGSGFPKLRSAVTLLESEGRRILVDSGLIDDGAKLVAALAARGLAPEDVDTIVTTHLHYDHCGNHLLFPNAKFLVGVRDFEDTHDFIAHYHADTTPDKTATANILRAKNATIKDFYVRSIVREVTRNLAFYDTVLARDPRFELIADDVPTWLTSEVEIVPSPGHTPGHISVVAHQAIPGNSAHRAPLGLTHDAAEHRHSVLIGGDAISLDANGERHLAWSPELYKQTREALLARFEWVIPGHDALVCHHEVSLPPAANRQLPTLEATP
jgi:glyoxylase-like metal-dependent hydrolase (beta-lactamase superfamily II)